MINKFFSTKLLYDGVTGITGISGECAFLVCGNKKALLIDTLYGVGSIKSLCEELTDLPITVVNTHGHVDHVGCNAEFEQVYIHPLDIDMSYFQMTVEKKIEILTRDGWMNLIKEKGIHFGDFVQKKSFFAIPIFDGEYFDLGGKSIEVIHIPGHSRGSIALLDINERILYVGDSIAPGTLMNLENSTSIKEYYASLLYLRKHHHRFDRLLWSHGLAFLPPEYIDETIELCEDILNHKDDAFAFPEHPFYLAKAIDDSFKRLDGKWVNIKYDKNHIHEKKRSKQIVAYQTRNFNMYD